MAGFIDVDGEADDPDERRYRLPSAHAEVLADPENPAFLLPFAPMLVGIAGALPDLTEAYRSGAGVPWERFGPDARHGQAAINRPAFIHDLPGWITAMGDVADRLASAPPARVADLGCGGGYSTLAIARAFPGIEVKGIDLDEASIAEATALLAGTGLEDRVTFAAQDAAALGGDEPYDLICIFEALHDMPQPTATLQACRAALAPGGSVLIADERVAEEFTAPGDEVERMMYGWSVTCCLATSLTEQPSQALGTVLRPGTMRRLAAAAGFDTCEVLPIENDLFRFYHLR